MAGSRRAVLVLLGWMAWPASTSMAVADPAAALPPRFHVAADVRPVFAHLLSGSPTFRRQVDRLVEAGVRVVVDIAAPWDLPRRTEAVSTMVYDEGKVCFVRVRLRGGSDWKRSLPHELEHALEQVDGLNLARLAERHGSGVWKTSGTTYETSRAVAAAEQVVAELRRAGDPPVQLAQRAVP